MQTDKSLGALAIFASLAGLVIFIFFIYNLYLIATGVTTNESFKWEDIGEMIYRRELVEVIEKDANGEQFGPKRYEQRDRRHPSHPRYAGPPPSEQPQQQQPQQRRPPRPTVEHVISKMKEIDNIYDRGVKENLSSILWPPSLDTVSAPARIAGLSTHSREKSSKKVA